MFVYKYINFNENKYIHTKKGKSFKKKKLISFRIFKNSQHKPQHKSSLNMDKSKDLNQK
jgi:hypothetical protein